MTQLRLRSLSQPDIGGNGMLGSIPNSLSRIPQGPTIGDTGIPDQGVPEGYVMPGRSLLESHGEPITDPSSSADLDRSIHEQGARRDDQQYNDTEPQGLIGGGGREASLGSGFTPVDFDPFALADAAAQGHGQDRFLGHLSHNDVVVPFEIRTPEINAQLQSILGKRLDRFTVGHPQNSINDRTGLPQFDSESGGDGPGAEGGAGGGGGTGGPGTGAGGGGGGPDTGGGGGSQPDPGPAPDPGPSPGPGPSQGGDKSSGSVGSGGGAQTDTGSGGGTGTPSGGEVGTGHGLGASVGGKGFGGGLPDAGLPEGATAFTGINMIDRALNTAIAHPGITAANAAFGLLAGPIAGGLNTASGNLGGPTVGSVAAGLGQSLADHGVDNGGNPGGTGDPGGGGPGASVGGSSAPSNALASNLFNRLQGDPRFSNLLSGTGTKGSA